MAAAHPFPPAELEAALKKVEKGEPLTHEERWVVARRLDELPAAREDLPADPVLRALSRARLGEPFTPEQEAELAEDLEDIRAGRARLVPHADVPRVIEEMRRNEG
jgi:hypothetical protein